MSTTHESEAVHRNTYGEQRTKKEKLYDAVVLGRIKRGIALLEREHGPDWVDKIDLEALDLRDAMCCVLGQVYADKGNESIYGDGYHYAVNKLLKGYGLEHGFCAPGGPGTWNALQQAWEDVLTPIIERKGDAV